MSKSMKKVMTVVFDRRHFSYKHGDTNLDFNLRLDVPDELVAFKLCMISAIADIEKELEKFAKK